MSRPVKKNWEFPSAASLHWGGKQIVELTYDDKKVESRETPNLMGNPSPQPSVTAPQPAIAVGAKNNPLPRAPKLRRPTPVPRRASGTQALLLGCGPSACYGCRRKNKSSSAGPSQQQSTSSSNSEPSALPASQQQEKLFLIINKKFNHNLAPSKVFHNRKGTFLTDINTALKLPCHTIKYGPTVFCSIYKKQPGGGYQTNHRPHQILPTLDEYSWTQLEPPIFYQKRFVLKHLKM